jgi:hypothetical protein
LAKYPQNTHTTCHFSIKKFKKIKTYFYFLFFFKKKYCDRPEDVLLLSSIVIGHDACLQLNELVPASLNVNMANFLSFNVYDINLSKVMNDSNLNFVLLQTTKKSIIVLEDLDRFLTEKLTAMTSIFFYFVHRCSYPFFSL